MSIVSQPQPTTRANTNTTGLYGLTVHGVVSAKGGYLPAMNANKAVSATVKYPNTPESDAMREVAHLVTLSDNTVVEVMATDPMDAIEKVNK